LLTGIQAWRFAGIAFIALYAQHLLPGYFAWPAGLGDIAIGLSAPLVMRALRRDSAFAASGAFLTWNLLGILDLGGDQQGRPAVTKRRRRRARWLRPRMTHLHSSRPYSCRFRYSASSALMQAHLNDRGGGAMINPPIRSPRRSERYITSADDRLGIAFISKMRCPKMPSQLWPTVP
jgi:hypothetical protein